MISFSFNGISSKDLGIYAIDIDRTTLPDRDYLGFKIPGRDGEQEYELGRYHNRKIKLQLAILGDFSESELREKSRIVAQWLSKKGRLVFDDEPDKHYIGAVYSSVDCVRFGANNYLSDGFNAATSNVIFTLQPFAFSEIKKAIAHGDSPLNLHVKSEGSQQTKGVISIKNTGNTDITEIKIIRKAVL